MKGDKPMKTKRQRQEEALSRREKDYARLLDAKRDMDTILASKVEEWVTYADTSILVTPGDMASVTFAASILVNKLNAAARDITNLKAKLS